MNKPLIALFEDESIGNKIKKRLPYLFQLAELESSRAGQIEMEIELQKRIFENLGKQKYIKLPKTGTNPRGVEITQEALLAEE